MPLEAIWCVIFHLPQTLPSCRAARTCPHIDEHPDARAQGTSAHASLWLFAQACQVLQQHICSWACACAAAYLPPFFESMSI